MLKNIIKEFTQKNEGFDFTQFIYEFEAGMSCEKMCNKFKITEMILRKFVYSLGLNFVKSKRLSSIKELHQKLALESGENLNLVDDLESELEKYVGKTEQLYKSLTLVRDENARLRKGLRKEARNEDVVEHLLEELKQGLHSIEIPTTPFMLVDRSILNNQEAQPFVLLSDTHFNELIEGKYIEDYNEFNNQICLEGIDKLLTKVQRYGGDTLRIYLAGDILSGKIHSLDLKGQLPVTSSIIEMAYYLSDRLNKLAKQYKSIKVMMINGNHSRLNSKPTLDLKAFDFEHLLYELMRVQVTEKNVNFEYSYSTYLIDNIGTEDSPKYVGLFHGDNKSFNPTSEAGVLKQFGIFDELFGVRVHSLMSGHNHKAVFSSSPRGGSILVNGCASGSNQYGFNANFLPLQPYQWIGTWSKEGYVEEMECVRLR